MPKTQPTDEPRPAETTTQPTTDTSTADTSTAQVEQGIVEVEEREEPVSPE